MQRALLQWAAGAGRCLPFRQGRTPYRVLVAEVMCQQTQAETAARFIQRFLQRFPSPRELAAASEDEVLRLWHGLGYYRRALHLRQAAQEMVARHGGQVPSDPQALRRLPGVGPYIAGAVGSLAFGWPVPAVDANATRVLARLLALGDPVDTPAGRAALAAAARALLPPQGAGAWNEALMDLGALVCVPRSPRCGRCPLQGFCRGYQSGRPSAFPVRRPRARPRAVPVVMVLAQRAGQVAVRQRPRGGLLGGLWEFPTAEGAEPPEAVLARYGLQIRRLQPLGGFTYAFTHRRWQVEAFRAEVAAGPPESRGCWAPAARPPAGDPPPRRELQWVTPGQLAGLPLGGPARRLAAGVGLLPAK